MGRKFGPLLAALAAGGLWVSSQMTWVIAHIADDKSGSRVVDFPGSQWSLETTASALLLLAGAVAGLALRRNARRLIGAVMALAGAVVSWHPLLLLAYGPSSQRAADLLQGSVSSSNAVSTTTISPWAEVTAVDVVVQGPVLAMIAGACAVVGGVLLALYPGIDSAAARKYETKETRAEKLEQDLAQSPDSGRVMWDALDEDIDPTDRR